MRATDWPANYIVYDGSTSPDGHYGIIIPKLEDEGGGDPDNSPNYLVDLKAHRVVGKIDGVNYFQGQNHASLGISWNAKSEFFVADYDGRFGFDSIWLIRPGEKGLTQSDLGTRISKAINPLIAQQSHEPEETADISAAIRVGDDGKVRFRAVATTNPKELDDVHTYCALFQGTYDPASSRWTVTDARGITAAMFDHLSSAYFATADDSEYATAEGAAESYDRQLNDAYSALRFVLPKEKFAKVKAEQIAWLKKRDAAANLSAKNALTKARTTELQELLW